MKVEVYKCFIGSPGDTKEERTLCKEVFRQINKTIGEKFNFRVESIMWEDDSRPSFGKDGQDVINRQLLLKEYNLFIGIMWARFGSPTNRAESGTIEEFEDAYKKYKTSGDLEICMYFNSQPFPQKEIDPDQISKVFAFKKKVAELGGLYCEYLNPKDFKDSLLEHLTKYFLERHQANLGSEKAISSIESVNSNIPLTILTERLDRSLEMFDGQKLCWIDPILSRTNLISSNYNENFDSRVNIEELIESPSSVIIQAPPQFGLTCLANFLVLEAWTHESIWIYLDASKINRNALAKAVQNELKTTFESVDEKKIKCIVLDGWKSTMHGGMKILRGLSNLYSDIPIIVHQTIGDSDFLREPVSQNTDREFGVLHLLALPKTEIRKMVSSYNKNVYIDEEDKVLNKIVLDLDTLNIHRTPMNCLTLLKVSEKYFDEKTVNRTDMLDKVLSVLFDFHKLPTYQAIPDLKDCEFALGIFCENLLKSEKYSFTKDHFISLSKKACSDNYIDLDIESLFDILYVNGIIVETLSEFTFRATYWLFYFAAHRMHASKEFCDHIFNSGKYINYPEIIEFYTGIDRRRTDALEILNNDLSKTYKEVNEKLGLPIHIDPYQRIKWNPTDENINQARNEISQNVQSSNLPTQIKDQHSDNHQNQLRPYDQGIGSILEEYSLAVLMRKISASSRALRNSDYADAQKKKQLLDSIVLSYEQVAKAIMVLAPELAIKSKAAYAGQSFYLDGDFGDTVPDRINKIIQEIPNNVVKFFKQDISSEKIGPLLIEKINLESIPLNKYILIILLAQIRPIGWRKVVEKYIDELKKDSFYLYDLMGKLRYLYYYDYISDIEKTKLKTLVQRGYGKHEFGNTNPSKKVLSKFNQGLLKKKGNTNEE